MIPLRDDNPTTLPPVLTISLIAACALVFLYQVSLPPGQDEDFVLQYGAVPSVVAGQAASGAMAVGFPATWTLITSMFLHGGWMHLIGNMLYLWIFGNNIEDAMGHVRFIVFYLVCGVIAALSHMFTDVHSTIPMVGASGAISGVLGAYLLLYPRAQVLVLIPLGLMTRTMYVPAALVLGMWFVLQLVSGGASLGQGGGGVAWFAHVGGFLAGMALVGLFKRADVPFLAPARHISWSDRTRF
jgi:membrane associated rhomboid family serine protease